MGGSVADAVIGLAVLMASVIVHESCHGIAALALGDDTALKAGRITPNPVAHLDIVGSVILPLFLFFAGGPMFGYAKPVPVTPSRLRGTDRAGFAAVAAAGPLSNLILALLFATLAKQRGFVFAAGQIFGTAGSPGVYEKVLIFGFVWNITLAAFNLLPIPPLDGSRFLRLFLKPEGRRALDRIEPFGFLILFGLLFLLSEPFQRILELIRQALFRLLPL